MTKKQQAIIDQLKVDILDHDSYGHPEEHEYKTFEVTEHQPRSALVFVRTEVGLKKDDGTAAYLYRTRRHICIRPGGGTELLNARGKKGKALTTRPQGYWNVVHCVTM